MFAYRTNLKDKRFMLKKARKKSLLTDINLYKTTALSAKQPSSPLTFTPTPHKLKLRLKLKLKVRRQASKLFSKLQTLRTYRRSFSLRRTQYRVHQDQVSRTLRPYRSFYRYGVLTLPNLQQNALEELPFMGSSEARTAGSTQLTSFWHKHFPHVLRVRGPQWTNVLVKRMRWYQISPSTKLSFNLTSPSKKFFQKKILFSNKAETMPLDDDSTLKYLTSKVSKLNSFTSQSNYQFLHLVQLSNVYCRHLSTLNFYTTWNSTSESSVEASLGGIITHFNQLGSSVNSLNALFLHLTSISNRLFTQESLLTTPNFFNRNRLSVGTINSSATHNLTKLSTLKSLKSRLLTRTLRTLNPLNRLKTSLIFNKYYNFILMSKVRGQELVKRPLYSHFFSSVALFKRSLITIIGDAGSLQLRKMVINSKDFTLRSPRGLTNSFNFQYTDNIIESSADNNLINYWVKRSPLSFLRASLGIFTRVTNVSKGSWDASNLPLAFLGSPRLNPSLQPVVKNAETLNPLNILLYSGGDNSNNQGEFLNNPTLFKFMFWNLSSLSRSTNVFTESLALNQSLISNSRYSFSTRTSILAKSNLWPLKVFNYTIRRKVVKMVINMKYLPRTTNYFYKTLISFIEFYTGKKAYLKFNPFIENSLTYSDLARCYMWYNRVLGFQKLLGHRIFVHESLRIFHLAIRFRDPTFLANWIKAMLYRMSFWKYRILFRYIKYVFRSLFWSHFENLDFKGVRLMLRGKISVAGNARARSLFYSIGHTGHAEMNNRVLSHFTTVHSFTGVMGFRLTFYF